MIDYLADITHHKMPLGSQLDCFNASGSTNLVLNINIAI